MDAKSLPVGTAPEPLPLPHFPTVFQAVIWRNWELVPAQRLAKVLNTDESTVCSLAQAMGLPVPCSVNPLWLERGYITIIRANWHLLPYEQLLALLDWDAARLAFSLKEDDFLWNKLGRLKPAAERVACRSLTPDEIQATRRIQATMKQYFQHFLITAPKEQPFDFLKTLAGPAVKSHLDSAPAHHARPFSLKFAYSYVAPYGDLMKNPSTDYFPEGLLERLADTGVNGIWLPVMLNSVYPWEPTKDYSIGWEKRLESIRAIAERAGKHGLELYAYFNEPRAIPQSLFDGHPQLKGIELDSMQMATLCTSTPEVQSFLREGTAFLFKQVENLGGVFTITMSEYPTNCYSRCTGETACPRCAQRSIAEVVAEVNSAIAEGAHRIKPDARVIVWDWAWDEKWAGDAIDRLPDDVWLMCTSEGGKKTNVGGIPFEVTDYSISQGGPSERALARWRRAQKRGLKAIAKVQINNSWECSPVPFIPVPDLIDEHLNKLEQAGVEGLMLSWTLGGWPGGNMELMELPLQTWQSAFGPAADRVGQACRHFSAAFRELPFSIRLAYDGPQNVGPKNLLFEKPSGYRATMTGIPYDTLDRWRGAAPGSAFYPDGYPEEVFEDQFKRLTVEWRSGVDILKQAVSEHGGNSPRLTELDRMANAVYCLFRSTYLQICFIRRRAFMQRPDVQQELLNILDEEITLACRMHELIREDSRIGFEASNHYFFTANDMREKTLNCQRLQELIKNIGDGICRH